METTGRKIRINCFPRRMSNLVSHAKNPGSYVYFISDGDYVKIGKSCNVLSRLAEIQCGNPKPLSVLFAIPVKTEYDALDIEHAFHQVYQDYKMCGEWYDIVGLIDRTEFENEFGISKTVTFDVSDSDRGTSGETNISKVIQNNKEQSESTKFMTIRQIAKTGILPEYRIRQLVMAGEIPSFKAGTRNYINYQNVIKYLESF